MITFTDFNNNSLKNTPQIIKGVKGVKVSPLGKVQLSLFLLELRDFNNAIKH